MDYSEINLKQVSSETNLTTIYRYKQFYANLKYRSSSLVILDVGCNTGRGGEVLKKLNTKYTLFGIDCVAERLQKAERVYDRVMNCNTVAIPQANNSIDVILAGEFIEHLTYKDALLTLSEFYRILRKNGQILLTTPNPGYIKLKLTRASVLGGAHLSQFYPSDLMTIMRERGFSGIILKGSGRVAKYFGEFWPFTWIYGSYLIYAQK